MKFLQQLFKKFQRMDEAAAEKIRDKNADRKDAIEDSKTALKELKNAIAESMANVTKLEREKNNHKNNITKYNSLAENAMREGNENDATEFLNKVVESEQKLKTVTDDIKKDKAIIADNRKKLESFTDKIKDAETSIIRLHSREKAAKTRRTLLELGQSDAFSALDDINNDICEEEDKVTAMEELSVDPDQALEDKYSNAAANEDVKARLEKLKQKVS